MSRGGSRPSDMPERGSRRDPAELRKYPRSDVAVRVKLSLASDERRSFEATLPTSNISVGGLFLHSTFFLKVGTQLLVQLELPPHHRKVKAMAQVVRVESISHKPEAPSGFALRFTEYLDGSEVVLATHFLAPVLREFIQDHTKKSRMELKAEEMNRMVDVLAAWELKKAELGGDIWSQPFKAEKTK
ncbi:MAG: PilZ domain-containing protein [Myxococcaceae bacterium]|nr:PilZ domain-containing protein [Myxococcaceae bacterium]